MVSIERKGSESSSYNAAMKDAEREWVWDGGRPCIDLLNTVRHRWRDPVDTLTDPAAAAAWLVAAGLLSSVPPRIDADLLDRVRRLRDAVEAVLGLAEWEDAADYVNGVAALVPRTRLVQTPGEVPTVVTTVAPVSDAHIALGLVATDLIAMVASGETSAVKKCSHERCGLRYVDTTAQGSRRWCSMQRCGNRAKAARFARRSRSGSKMDSR